MTDTLMCQSVVNDVRGPFPCSVAASRVLFGIHLCGNHDNAWRPRLQRGEKIRIHPERALALDHRCTPPAPDVLRTCHTCGESKPTSEFYRQTAGNRVPMLDCKRCWNSSNKAARERRASSASPDSPAPSSPKDEPGARPPEGDVSPAPSAPAGTPSTREVQHTSIRPRGLPSAEVAWPPASMRTPASALDAWDKQVGPARPKPGPAPIASAPRPSADPTTPANVGTYAYVVEFTCSLCGRWVCDVEVGSRNAVALPKMTRCLVEGCGGAPQRSGEVRERYVGPGGRSFWDATSDEPAPWSDRHEDLEDVAS